MWLFPIFYGSQVMMKFSYFRKQGTTHSNPEESKTIQKNPQRSTKTHSDPKKSPQRPTAIQIKSTTAHNDPKPFTAIHNDYRKNLWRSRRTKDIVQNKLTVAVRCFSSFLYYLWRTMLSHKHWLFSIFLINIRLCN